LTSPPFLCTIPPQSLRPQVFPPRRLYWQAARTTKCQVTLRLNLTGIAIFDLLSSVWIKRTHLGTFFLCVYPPLLRPPERQISPNYPLPSLCPGQGALISFFFSSFLFFPGSLILQHPALFLYQMFSSAFFVFC